ncbi:hypothetical protein B0T24DRAFT_681482 [Lasiosphaeria ovina]|uniref:non-specific serine/threonine protein kinase n=1 Tax=Lasiosphaeria ovina TaxID=92902 RepID=A0AAE0K3M5_9PEZI|nr:hypothetical protein B0T24DRAFT_681482 [Lasiosphaeria ovina]
MVNLLASDIEAKRRFPQYRYTNSQYIPRHGDLDRYRPEGFHPVYLGDTFQDGRYVVRRKLGYGGWVSIKVKAAADPPAEAHQDAEVKTLLELRKRLDPDMMRFFVLPWDNFIHSGPTGTHCCIVTELCGPTVSKDHGFM